MVARVRTVAFRGVDTLDIDVQVHMGNGLPAFSIVGLPAKAVDESKDRVRAALSALGLALPPQRITVNLAPADVTKEGSHYDLPIAVGILVQMGVLPADEIAGYLVLGELALDGQLTEVSGILPAALGASARGAGIICPESCGPEAAWAGNIEVLAPRNLLALINHFKGSQVLTPPDPAGPEAAGALPDLADVKGQESAKRALEIAAAGGHNLLMTGPPGAGKSMLAARLPGLLPPLEPREALEVAMIRSVAGDLKGGRISRTRPYRDPHHSSSIPALVGGGLQARPGEVSLAHCGVLFLDELAEFPRTVLDSLRQSIETGQAVVSRANNRVTYPARFQLIAAMNPCRCGYLSDPAHACGRAPKCGLDYQARLSGPLLDRFDLRIEIEPVSARALAAPPEAEPSETVAARVARARQMQKRRFEAAGEEGIQQTNAGLNGRLLEQAARPEPAGQALMEEAAHRLSLSARGYHRILRVARTIADLEGSEPVRRTHVAEALAYRGIVLKQAA
ncbi:YifB family Mg chelatase-like AAA ATPase [Nisaea acidiphila]|uniref:YifB family Mg chelatase-like AAA ATPase n=1 Tax=Nisaea acidiphila TaxID=1862145 RepID=A0A9J7B0I7_9PROT|nr:YifB family Mg chelatase-like AAA ATPase [Nisaea acidiphila]UUX52169.1 YifB family Mg chelatase-like AAA ATPase [Nisaea acidiphila]